MTAHQPRTILDEIPWRREVARRLQSARIRAGMTQQALAAAVGRDRAVIANYEAARQSMDSYVLFAVAVALRCPLGDLLPLSQDDLNGMGDPEDPGWVLARAEEMEELELLRKWRSGL